MMQLFVEKKRYEAPPLDRREILRYAMAAPAGEQQLPLLESCLEEAEEVLNYQVCWREFPLARREDVLDLGFAVTASQSARRFLEACESVVVFAATLGLGLDRLIARHSRLSPARALLLQAIGTERIEALCDAFCGELAQSRHSSARFSPGYGDLPLELQSDIFRVLDCHRMIGLSLNESLMMTPSKSVTALVGISRHPLACPERGCAVCGMEECFFRGTR